MHSSGHHTSSYGLDRHGIQNTKREFWNLGTAQLIEAAIRRDEGMLTESGAFVVLTGAHTGRSPKDKYIVRDAATESTVDWGSVNRPFSAEAFDRLHNRLTAYLQQRELFVQDCYAGADPKYRLPVRVITEHAWHNLFARQLLLQPAAEDIAFQVPEFTIIQAPDFQADPNTDETQSPVFIILNFTRRMVLIGGTSYAGEIKKSVFSIMNYLLPGRDVLPMHCSANVAANGEVALFFGLSGTGKTTLSADPERGLIGDDEHGWGADGVFNIEGGCYAKVIKLSKKHEPDIYRASNRFGAILENVVVDPHSRQMDFNDGSLTENTRAAYEVDFIDNAVIPGVGGHPNHILFLTCDAFGVLPPISRLTPQQAMYHFLSGYTAKVAGTEKGVGNEPQVTFSSCFGAPFLPRNPSVYARMLGEQMRKHQTECWLVNTGWSGGPFGVGSRMSLPVTRALVRAALSGQLSKAEFQPHPIFKADVPQSCPGVDGKVLDPKATWADPKAYDEQAKDLARRFSANFAKFDVDQEVRDAGPSAD